MWLTIKQYADRHKLTPSGVKYRIDNELIHSSRISKNDGGKIIINELNNGIDKTLPKAKEVDDLLADPDIYNKVSDIIIDSEVL